MLVSINIATGLWKDYILFCETLQQNIGMAAVTFKSVKNVKPCYANTVLAEFLCNIYTAWG